MAAIANITLKDRTGADITLSPLKAVAGSEAHWIDRNQPVAALRTRASVFQTESGGTRKVTGKVTRPVLDADGETIHTEIYKIEVVTVNRLSDNDHADVESRGQALADSAVFQTAVVSGEMPW